MLVAPGKSLFVLPVPCQLIVHPPDCLPMLSAASPATKILAFVEIGKTELLFFNNTNDLRTASRAISRCSWLPIKLKSPTCSRFNTEPASNKPAVSLTRKIRETASSNRAIAMSPFFTLDSVLLYKVFQSLSGAIIKSMPALTA